MRGSVLVAMSEYPENSRESKGKVMTRRARLHYGFVM